MLTKCSTLSTMLISSRYVSAEHPFGFGGSKPPKYIDFEGSEGYEDKKDKKDKKEKKDKDKEGKSKKGDKKKDKGKKDKDIKGNKDKDKDKKGKDKDKKGKDKDKGKGKGKGKDKKGKKDKKDKNGKKGDKEDEKDKKEKREKKDKKDNGEDKKGKDSKNKENDPTYKLHSIRDSLLRRGEEGLSVFAPCMTFVKCPYGPEGEECSALKKAAISALNADRCWFRYMEELSQCQANKGKDCIKRLSELEQTCKNHAFVSDTQAKFVLKD